MQLPKPTEGGNFEPCPAGTFTAICYRFIDLGTHENEYMGERKTRHEVLLSWEIVDETMADGRPFTASKKYTWSMHEKATLRKDLEAWRGKAFEDADFDGPSAFNVRKLIGKPCTLTVTHDVKSDKTYSKVAAVGKVMRGIVPPNMTNDPVYIALTADEFDGEAFGKLSDKLKALITGSPEYLEISRTRARHDDPGAGYSERHPDDDIPF